MKLDLQNIQQHRLILENHPLLTKNRINSIEHLRIFMQHHVYAVWDFMCLLKTLQHNIVPSSSIWMPTSGTRSDIARMINEIVLCEESDISPDGKSSISHFDLYMQAMLEVNADTTIINQYLDTVKKYGNYVDYKLAPEASMQFVKSTFDAINNGPHCAAASFCYGRESVIPAMFKKILKQLDISETDAPKFHYYLERHIEVDGESHGPMSEYMVNYFCKDDPILIHEAEQTAIQAIKARIKLFDNIESLLI